MDFQYQDYTKVFDEFFNAKASEIKTTQENLPVFQKLKDAIAKNFGLSSPVTESLNIVTGHDGGRRADLFFISPQEFGPATDHIGDRVSVVENRSGAYVEICKLSHTDGSRSIDEETSYDSKTVTDPAALKSILEQWWVFHHSSNQFEHVLLQHATGFRLG